MKSSSVHEGRHYLVVGASSGIGASIALELASLGANITMVARRTEKMLELQQRMVPGSHACYGFDVSRLSEIFALVEKIDAERGAIDGCVYCAGVGAAMRLRGLLPEKLHAVMRVNFYAFVEFVRALARKKRKEQDLRIVALSSLASISSDKYKTAYSASKAAMDAAVRCLSRELASNRVTINSIRPAVVDVERLRGLDELTGGLDAEIKKNGYQPLGIIPPKDIAGMAAWLLSDAARYLTGTSLPFNGGAAC